MYFLISGILASLLLDKRMLDSSVDKDLCWNRSDRIGMHSFYETPYQNLFERNSTESNKNHVCNRCGKTYKATTSLSRHMRLECGVIPAEICRLCNKRFKHKFVLNSHIVGCQRRLSYILREEKN